MPTTAAADARALRWAIAGILAYTLLYLGIVAATPAVPATTASLVAGIVSAGGPILAGMVILERCRRSSMGGERAGWRLVAAAFLAWGAGSLAFTAIEDVLGGLPFPSIADLGYVLFPLLMLVGVLRIFRPQRLRAKAELLVDVLAISLVGIAVLWVGILQPILEDASLAPLEQALLLLYPSTDLLLVLAVVIGHLGRSRLTGRVAALFTVGMIVFLVGDLVFALGSAAGTYASGGLHDLTWSLGALLIACSALLVDDGPVAVPSARRSADVATLALLAVPIVGLFVFTTVAWEASLGVSFIDWLFSPAALDAIRQYLGVFLVLSLSAAIAIARVVSLVRDRSRSAVALERSAAQIAATADAQSEFLQGGETNRLFDRLLASLLSLSDSSVGFLGEVVQHPDGPHLRTRALTDTPWLRAAAGMSATSTADDIALMHVDTAFGQVLTTGTPMIVNDPSDPAARARFPVVPFRAFLALPIFHQGVLTGVAGLADRPSGYDAALIAELEPFLTTCATLIRATGDRDRLRQREAALVERNRQLEEVDRLKDGLIAAAEDASRAKSEFLATMSHEVRTPLHGIIGSVELLRGSVHDPDGAAQLDLLARSAERQLHLVDEILDFSRVEARRVEIQPAPLDLRALLRELVELQRPAATAKGLALRLMIEPGVPPLIEGDHVRLSQVVSNLVGNAIKFSDEGSVIVELATLDPATSRTGATIVIRVVDTGPGIDPAVRSRIFEPFFQVDATTARRHGGAGIGLSVAHRLVELMGGEIVVGDTPGHGTTFRVELPLPVAPVAPGPAAGEAGTDGGAHARGARPVAGHEALTVLRAPAGSRPATTPEVLVVDDDPVAGQVTAGFLRRLGRTPVVVPSGGAALERLAERPPDLVLLDLQMPGMDGYAVAREQRRREMVSGAPPVAIVATSADAYEDARRRCAEAGMDGHLTKPFRTPDLARVLELWAPATAGTPDASVPDPPLDAVAAGPDAAAPVVTAQLIDLFLATGSERVAAIAVAMAMGDPAAAVAPAHAMRGASLAFGETALADAAAAIEAHVAGGAAADGPGPLELAQAFTEAFGEARARLLALRAQLAVDASVEVPSASA